MEKIELKAWQWYLYDISMKVLLVRPLSPIITFSIPAGLLYISSWLKKELGVDVEILDARLNQLGDAEISRRIKSSGADIVGIGAMSVEAKEAHHTAKLVKETNRNTLVVMGGPYPSASRLNVLKDPNVDFAISGEGELPLKELVKAIQEGNRTGEGVPGIMLRDGSEPVVNSPVKPLQDLDQLPFPDWSAIDLESYFSNWRNGQNKIRYSKRGMPVFSSRGCPYSCIFCHGMFGKAFRARSPESVIKELEILRNEYGVEEIEFNDDIFNLDLKRAKSIARNIIDSNLGLKFAFPNGLRADLMDYELVDLLVEMGTYRIMYAVESANERMQKVLKKQVNIEKTREIINYTTRKGIITGAFFIMGLPDETEEEIEENIAFACSLNMTIMTFAYLTPYPGNNLGQEFLDNDRDPTEGLYYDYTNPRFNFSRVSDKLLRAKRREAYRRFYMNPARIAHIVRRVPKNFQLLRNGLTTLKLSLQDSVMY